MVAAGAHLGGQCPVVVDLAVENQTGADALQRLMRARIEIKDGKALMARGDIHAFEPIKDGQRRIMELDACVIRSAMLHGGKRCDETVSLDGTVSGENLEDATHYFLLPATNMPHNSSNRIGNHQPMNKPCCEFSGNKAMNRA